MTERITRAFGVRPFDLYGTTEGLWGAECEHHDGLHLFEDWCIAENVDADGRAVPDGEPGARLLVTNLHNRTLPMLRFAISDMVVLDRSPCACGRTLPRLRAVHGRLDDVLHLPGAAGATVPIHPTQFSVVAGDPAVREFQVRGRGDGVLVLPRARRRRGRRRGADPPRAGGAPRRGGRRPARGADGAGRRDRALAGRQAAARRARGTGIAYARLMLQHVTLEVRADEVRACVAFWELLGFEEIPAPPALRDEFTWVQRAATQIHLVAAEQPAVAERGHVAVLAADYDGDRAAARRRRLRAEAGAAGVGRRPRLRPRSGRPPDRDHGGGAAPAVAGRGRLINPRAAERLEAVPTA